MNIIILFMAINPGGFFEYQGEVFKIGENFAYTGTEKLNLTLKQKLSNTFFRIDLIFVSYHGKISFDLRNFLPYSLPDSIPFTYSPSLYFRNAFVRFRFSPVTFQFGRQQIGWGTGYAYNPTNVFQRKSIIEPTYELDGVDALRMMLDLNPEIGLDVLYFPAVNTDSSSYGVRARGSFPIGDVSMGWISYERPYLDDFLQMIKKRTNALTMDFSTELMGAGVHGEGIYNYGDKMFTGVLGIDYTFSDGLTYLLIEYLYNDYGKVGSNNYTLSDWMGYLQGTVLSLGRNEVFFNIERTFELLKIRLSGLYNPDDKSVLVLPGLDYSLSDLMELVIIGSYGYGDEGAEYSQMYKGAMFRIRFSF